MRVLDLYPWVAECFEFEAGAERRTNPRAMCGLRCHRSGPTVSFGLGDGGRLLVKCFAGCATLEVLRAAGLTYRDCFPAGTDWRRVRQEVTARYAYADERGDTLYRVVRLEPGYRGTDKTFRQQICLGSGRWVWGMSAGWYKPTGRPDYFRLGDMRVEYVPAPEGTPGAVWVPEPRRVLYRLFDLTARPDATVLVVAGEKDVESVRALGNTAFVATTNVGGESAGWLDAYSETLAGRDVVVVEDRDSAGRRHAHEVAGSLMGHARSLLRVALPDKDATAFLNRKRREGVTDRGDLTAELFAAIDAAGGRRWAPVCVGDGIEVPA